MYNQYTFKTNATVTVTRNTNSRAAHHSDRIKTLEKPDRKKIAINCGWRDG